MIVICMICLLLMTWIFLIFFFFKQKTAYELRISDWSSDVCSSDLLHLVALHRFGSNNPLGIDVKSAKDQIPFHPYYTVKDAFGLGVFLIVFSAIVFFAPNLFGEPDNYIPADPLVTQAQDRKSTRLNSSH